MSLLYLRGLTALYITDESSQLRLRAQSFSLVCSPATRRLFDQRTGNTLPCRPCDRRQQVLSPRMNSNRLNFLRLAKVMSVGSRIDFHLLAEVVPQQGS
jgi:hypothetical protein